MKTKTEIEYSATEIAQASLCYMSASELLTLFKAGLVSPVTVLEEQIARIHELNPAINAITAAHFEEARAQAKESESRYLAGNPRPLEGITCAIKDEFDVLGWRTSMGSLICKDAPLAKQDAPLITFLRNAGVVMHIQTNIPEYYCNLVTWNKLFGVCRNPWNLEYTPGGSSGGSAAALVAGFSTLATGSDMGGSIRFPAAMSGLYGFKPPYGRVPTSLTQYESSGPITRTFEDLNLLQNVMTGKSPRMPSSLPKLEYPLTYQPINGWRIAYDPMTHWGIPLDNTVKKSMEEAVTTLRSLGAEVVEVDLNLRASDFETYACGIFSTSLGPFGFEEPKKYPHLITPYLSSLIEKYDAKASPKSLANGEYWAINHHINVQEKVFLQGCKAIIMPTMCTPYVKADMGTTPNNTVVTINGELYPVETWAYSFTWLWNNPGHYPIVNVPNGITPDNIPLGMQIIGDTFDDISVFQIASAWSKASPRFFKEKNFPRISKLDENIQREEKPVFQSKL